METVQQNFASQQPGNDPVTQPAGPVATPALRLAHKVSDSTNRVRLRLARAWNFKPKIVAYYGYGSTEWVRVFGRALLATSPKPGSRAEQAQQNGTQNVRGWSAFTSVPMQHTEVDIEIGGVHTRVRADRGGLVDEVIKVKLTPGWHTVTFRADGTEEAQAQVRVIGPDTSLGVVCDIDDTVMVTALPRPFLALWNTFVLSERARMATPGMAVMLDRFTIRHPDAPVIYLSTGPWNAAPTLARFLVRNMYPAGAMLLTDWGLTPDRWFRSGQEHKHRNLERLATEFPGMKWLLIGDNGQHDEQIYSEFSVKFPDRVAAIAIRQLSVGESVLAGGHTEHGDHSAEKAPWIYSPDGAGIARRLENLGLL